MGKMVSKQYFMDEIRDGFFVPGMIKKSWAMSQKNLVLLSETAKRAGVECVLFFGSMIGAVRYGGSIPWDDDIDTVMTRNAYNRFKRYIDEEGIPENHYLRDYTEMDNGNLVRKWMDSDDVIKSENRWDEDYGFPFVNNVDIMILDQIPDSAKDRQYYKDVVDLCQHVKNFADMLEQGESDIDEEEFLYSLDLLQRVLKTKYIPEKDSPLSIWVWKVMEKFLTNYAELDVKEMGSLPHFMFNEDMLFPTTYFETYVEMRYESDLVRIPIGYDGILRRFYGNYMYPAVEFSGHFYPNYKMLESIMKEHYGGELLRYHYDREKAENLFGECKNVFEGMAPCEIKQVVFLVRNPEQWAAFHTLWKMASEDDRVDVKVIVLPYFYKDAQGRINENEMIVEDSGYPEEVELTPFDSYDPEVEKTDIVIYGEPYDEYHDCYTIHPYYYVENLRRFVKKLAFISPFVLDEISHENERARFTLGCFIRNKGLVLADSIYVQSEQMKDVYTEILSDMCPDIDWDHRIYGMGSPSFDMPDPGVRISDEKEYVLAYHINASVLYEHGNKVLDRARGLIDIIEEKYGDSIRVIVYTDANIDKVFPETKKGLYEKYSSFIEGLKINEHIRVVGSDETEDVRTLAKECDGFFGDGSVLMNEIRELKKPVLWQTPWADLKKTGRNNTDWTSEIKIATEGEWDINHFLDEMIRYTDSMRDRELSKTEAEYGRMIWQSIISDDKGKTESGTGIHGYGYFCDEVRDGFYVPGRMKRAWKKDLKSYKAIEGVCDKLGVSIGAMWGTLLGAVRNGGFIPWDDDIDLEMLHVDYDRVFDYLSENTLDNYMIGDYRLDEHENLTRRWMSGNALVEPYETWKENYGFPFVSILDIFLMEYMPTESESAKEYWEILHEAGSIKEYDKNRDKSKLDTELATRVKELEKKMGISIDKDTSVPLFIRILVAMDKYTAGFSKDKSDCISIPAYYDRNPAIKFSKRLFEHYISVSFEDESIRVPIGYDGILRTSFGDYMKPVMAEGAHSYPFYEAMNGDAKEVSGFELASYVHDESLVCEKKRSAKDAKNESLKEKVTDTVGLFKEAHDYIVTVFTSDIVDISEVTGLLSQCQELAVGIGDEIEKRSTNPQDMIGVLEEYCEYVYGLFQRLEEGTDMSGETGDIEKDLDKYLERMKERTDELCVTKEVVILSLYASDWNVLLPLYEEIKDDKDYRVTVICVPFYEKADDGSVLKDKKRIDKSIPKAVNLTDYDAYDFELMHPDILIYTYTQDEFTEGVAIHPYFHISNLARFSDKLVWIPSFFLNEGTINRGQSVYTLGTVLKTPGVAYADVILAQSHEMRDVYENVLYGFSPEMQKRIHIVDVGLPMSEEYEDHESGVDPTEKGVFLYRLGASMLYEHTETAIKKAKSTLDYMNGFEEVNVVWSVDPYDEAILAYDSELKIAYDNLKNEYEERVVFSVGKKGTCEDDKKLEGCIIGYFGDGCVLMNECRIKGKPVMMETAGVDDLTDEEKVFIKGVIKGEVKSGSIDVLGSTGKLVWQEIKDAI